MDVDEIRTVGVLGAGTMGHGIAEVVALAGYQVLLYDVKQEYLDAGVQKLKWSVGKLVEKGLLSQEKGGEVTGRVRGTLDLRGFCDTDLVIEAVPEDLSTKVDLFKAIARENSRAIIASNTSTIPITELAASTGRSGEFVGLHFFNPPVLMPLVEVIRGERTDQRTLETAVAFAKKLGKEVVVCRKDVPGFIVNRILGPLLNEAAWTVARGQATIEGVDSAAIYKVGLPMGLFELADYSGIDVIYKAAESVRAREPTTILDPPLFREKVEQGKLGRKTGEGFYKYPDPRSRPSFAKEAGESVDPLLFFSAAVNSAAWILRNGVCSKDELDLSVRLGLGFPEGILRMADRWGVDKTVSALRTKQQVYGDDYAPDPLLEEMLRKGELGVSSGRGFYEYSSSERRMEDVILRKSAPIAWITLNRPQKLNTLSPRLIDELETVAKDVSRDGSIRVVVLRGEGGKAFSAGADLTSFESGAPDGPFNLARRLFEVLSLFEKMPKPVVAAIEGYALGGGCELALACDFRLAAESSVIGQTETNLGLIPGAGGTQRLVRVVGLAKAKEMIFFGTKLKAQEALRIGLVDRVFPNADFQRNVEEFVKGLARRAPLALKFAKLAINLAGQVPPDLAQYFEASSFGALLTTEDASEGISSFLSKREPEFKGR